MTTTTIDLDAPASKRRLSSLKGQRGVPCRRPQKQLAGGDLIAIAGTWAVVASLQGSSAPAKQAVGSLAAVASTLVAMRSADLYRHEVYSLWSRLVTRVVATTIFGALVYTTVAWLTGKEQIGPSLAGAATAGVAVIVLRWRFQRWLTGQHANGRLLDTAVIVGNNADTLELSTMLMDEPELGYRVGAVLGTESQTSQWATLPHYCGLDRLAEVVANVAADDVIVIASALSPEERTLAVELAQATASRVHLWPGVPAISSRRVRLSPISGLPALSIEPQKEKSVQAAVKRVVDIVLAAILIPLVAPVLLAAAVWIKLDDGGPVFYRHSVIGRFGVPTTVWKLRTMVPNAVALMDQVALLNERRGGPLFKASNDPRVTRVGRILRATSIDELPQLWNVLRGTLSLVGPRFALPSEVEHFDDGFLRRQKMRPGITGLWQTEARDNPSFSAYRRLDLFYVDNWSLALDVSILANTAYLVSVRALRAIFSRLSRETPK